MILKEENKTYHEIKILLQTETQADKTAPNPFGIDYIDFTAKKICF